MATEDTVAVMEAMAEAMEVRICQYPVEKIKNPLPCPGYGHGGGYGGHGGYGHG